jgi:hypothetical protein
MHMVERCASIARPVCSEAHALIAATAPDVYELDQTAYRVNPTRCRHWVTSRSWTGNPGRVLALPQNS